MYADHVKCVNCGKELYVERGMEECPLCKPKPGFGTLAWVDVEYQEVEVYGKEEEEIIEKGYYVIE